ncbi:MAG: 1-acyl-sn-glycerol-3-phosphate acyltransferase [Magnetococcales bacterium]|nr:1-acyl-sn-glycerol-3-phosphate acyltransferase [Magnetococcales bacterium]
MIVVRSTLFFIMFVLGILFFSLLIVLLWPVAPLAFRQRLTRHWASYNSRMLGWICHLHHRLEGVENLPSPPFVIMSKHQSAWETVVFHNFFPNFVWVLKHNLKHIPFFGWSLQASGQIFIDRSHGIEAMKSLHRQGQDNFRRGISLLIFPEGTRVAPGSVGEYKAGGVGLAMAAGVPIVPVAHNAGEYWGRRAFLEHPGVIQVRIGQPVLTEGLSRRARQEVLDKVQGSIEGMMAEITRSGLAESAKESS